MTEVQAAELLKIMNAIANLLLWMVLIQIVRIFLGQ